MIAQFKKYPILLGGAVLAMAMLLLMIRPVIMAAVFPAQGFAEYSLALLVSNTFCVFGCFGMYPLLQRRMPMSIVKGSERSSYIILLQSLLVAAAVTVTGWLCVGLGGWHSEDKESFFFGLLHGFSQQAFLLVTVESRSRGELIRFAKDNLLRAALIVGFGTAAAIFTGKAYISILVESIATLVLCYVMLGSSFEKIGGSGRLFLSLAIKRFKKIDWVACLSLSGAAVAGFAVFNFDRWVVAGYFSSEEFAYYSFAWILILVAQSVQAIFNSSVFPSIARIYAAEGRGRALMYASRFGIFFLAIGIVFSIPGVMLSEYFIDKWFPSYEDSIQFVPVFIFVAVLRIADFWTGFLVVDGRERGILLINIFTALVGIGLAILGWLVCAGGVTNLLNIAYLASVTSFIRLALIVFLAFKNVDDVSGRESGMLGLRK